MFISRRRRHLPTDALFKEDGRRVDSCRVISLQVRAEATLRVFVNFHLTGEGHFLMTGGNGQVLPHYPNI